MTSKKLIHLECARGIASFIVLFHHFFTAFQPEVRQSVWENGVHATPLYIIMNGKGAVIFFFILSGFVLTYRMYSNPSIQKTIVSSFKRLPRLMLPVGCSMLLGLLVLQYGGAQYIEASEHSGSSWLGQFANAAFPENFSPSLMDVFTRSFMVFILPQHEYYNTNLWTMRSEFLGSLLVFGILFIYASGFLLGAVSVLLLHFSLLVVFTAIFPNPAFIAFVLGSLLAYWFSKVDHGVPLSRRVIFLGLVIVIGGFSVRWWPGNMIASFLLLIILLKSRTAETHLSGRIGNWLGQISFPLYLVHTLVILSFSSSLYTFLADIGMPEAVTLAVTLAETILLSCLLSIPLLYLDFYWVRWLNSTTRYATQRLQSTIARAY